MGPMTRTKPKVLLAMSGGVDSSVAAVLLAEAGYDVTGVFLCLGTADKSSRGCCSPQDAACTCAQAGSAALLGCTEAEIPWPGSGTWDSLMSGSTR